jgi:hypothetical protein
MMRLLLIVVSRRPPRGRNPFALIALGLIGLFVVSACDASPAAKDVGSEVISVDLELDGRTWTAFVQSGQEGDSRSAAVEGSVAFDVSTSCVYMRNGSVLVAVVWPEGTKLGPDAMVVELPDGTVLADGAEFMGSGGYEPHPEILSTCPDGIEGEHEVFIIDQAAG